MKDFFFQFRSQVFSVNFYGDNCVIWPRLFTGLFIAHVHIIIFHRHLVIPLAERDRDQARRCAVNNLPDKVRLFEDVGLVSISEVLVLWCEVADIRYLARYLSSEDHVIT